MICLRDWHKVEDVWYLLEAEVYPCSRRWNHGHGWFVEMGAAVTDSPAEGAEHGIFTHFVNLDVAAWTLRTALFRGQSAMDKLREELNGDPSHRPTWEWVRDLAEQEPS